MLTAHVNDASTDKMIALLEQHGAVDLEERGDLAQRRLVGRLHRRRDGHLKCLRGRRGGPCDDGHRACRLGDRDRNTRGGCGPQGCGAGEDRGHLRQHPAGALSGPQWQLDQGCIPIVTQRCSGQRGNHSGGARDGFCLAVRLAGLGIAAMNASASWEIFEAARGEHATA